MIKEEGHFLRLVYLMWPIENVSKLIRCLLEARYINFSYDVNRSHTLSKQYSSSLSSINYSGMLQYFTIEMNIKHISCELTETNSEKLTNCKDLLSCSTRCTTRCSAQT